MTKFLIEGAHPYGEGWVSFRVTGNMLSNLDMNIINGERIVKVGSFWVGNSGYGMPLKATVIAGSNLFLINGSQIIDERKTSGFVQVSIPSGWAIFRMWFPNPNSVVFLQN